MDKPYRNRHHIETPDSHPGRTKRKGLHLPGRYATDGSAAHTQLPAPSFRGVSLSGGIRSRLYLLISLILIPMLLMFAWFYTTRYRNRRAQALETELEVSRGLATTVWAYLSDINNENYAVGRALASFGYSDAESGQRLLSDIVSRYAAMESLNWLSPEGVILLSSTGTLVGADISGRTYFRRILEGRPWVTSDLIESGLLTGNPVITIATAIPDGDGSLLGVMVAAIDPSRLAELIHPDERPAGGAYAIFDTSGSVVYRTPRLELSWRERTEWTATDHVLRRVLETGESEVGITEFLIPGGTWVSARVPVPETGYVAGSGRPVSYALAHVRENVYQGAAFTLLVAILALIAASLVARTISEPLLRLERDAAKMKTGSVIDRDHRDTPSRRFSVRTPEEIERLRSTVTKMAADLLNRAEDLMRERTRLRSALVSAELGTWSLNAVTGMLRLDTRNRKLFGISERGELSINDVTARLDPEDRASVLEAIDRATEPTSDGRFDIEFRTRDRSGGIHWVRGTGRSIFEGEGPTRRATQLLGVIMDMTKYKETERELIELNETLEERVRLRTMQLESANNELEAFSYSVSHDLRAPLRSIDGFSKLLLEKHAAGLSDQARNYLDRVRNAAQRMGRLIDDLLMLSRIGRKELRRDTIDLSALAKEVFDELRSQESERRVTVEIEPGLTAAGDAELLRIVLDNLLGNAWKFTSRTEGAEITFSAVKRDGERFFRVRDNGAGFEMTYADKLFHPFQRLHTESEYSGTGIGLATVQRIIARHGGQVFAESEPGEGASFYFSLGDTDEI